MILRKPYAFLVKHFRLIHAVLLMLIFFVFFQVYDILGFFNTYIGSPTSIYDLSTTEIKNISAFTDDNFVLNESKQKSNDDKEFTYFYADTECDVSGEYHKAFCISFKERNDNEIKTFIGEDCLDKFMDILPDNAVVYFHNLGYDVTMFTQLEAGKKRSKIMNNIDKGSKTISQTI